MSPQDPTDHFPHVEHPTADQPLHGERRSTWKPLLLTVVVFAVLIALYLLGSQLIGVG